MKLNDLLDLDLLREMIAQGYVGMQDHWSDPLTILNYTHAAQYDRVWNLVTRQCRGLIVRRDSFYGDALDGAEVVARPWPKFHNYGELGHTESELDLAAPVVVTDKLDGSLGILYPTPCGYAVATRGSFMSEQAIHATAVLIERYSNFRPDDGLTYLFEVIYPENRIVVNYDGLDDLVLIGVIKTETGEPVPPLIGGWPGRHTEVMEADSLADALALPPRSNAEGVVVRYIDSGLLVKIKQEDYVALHRIVTGLNERVVWERLGAGETIADLCEGLPDEFVSWVEGVAGPLYEAAQDVLGETKEQYSDIMLDLMGREPPIHGDDFRRYFAEQAKTHGKYTPWLFLMLDQREQQLHEAIWRSLRPTHAGQWMRKVEVTAE